MLKCSPLNTCGVDKEICIICLHSKKIHLECKKCYSCKICKDCILPLTNTDLHERCPLCRELEWKEPSMLSSQIIPLDIELNLDTRITEIYNKPIFKNICNCWSTKHLISKMKLGAKRAYFTFLIIFMCYILGLLCVFIVIDIGSTEISPYLFIFVPFPLGFLIISIILYCCFSNRCLYDFKHAICSSFC